MPNDEDGKKLNTPETLNPAYTCWQLGLPNALKLEQDMRGAVPRPSAIVLGLSSLREISGLYGRRMGDVLLIEARDYFLAQKIPASTLYRISGSRFCITIEDIAPGDLEDIANRLAARFDEPWILKDHENEMRLMCDVSKGVIHSDFLHNTDDIMTVVERVSGVVQDSGSKSVVYSREEQDLFEKRRRFEASLKRCVVDGMKGFGVHYQPIADPATGTWCGLEALCRWISPELGAVPPDVFISAAERLNLIEIIGLWVLETAVRKCKEWGLDKINGFILDVNVSAAQFSDPMLAEKIMGILRKYDFPGERLCLELTESTQFTFSGFSLRTIQRIKDAKISIALDDFGTGYSAFNKLRELPVDVVKVERNFIFNIENDSYLRYLFGTITGLAHAADMMVVAEGVETPEQMRILLENGVDYLQGYLFSEPLPTEEIEKRLDSFHEVDKSFRAIRKQKFSMPELLKSQSNSAFAPTLHKLTTRCLHTLLYGKNTDEAVEEALRDVGTHIGVSRAYVFLRDMNMVYTNTHEWCAKGVVSQKGVLKCINMPGSWLSALYNDEIVISSDISDLPPEVYEILELQNIKAVLSMPLWEEGEIFGFIGFDDCEKHRDWQPEEILMLHNLSLIIGNVLHRYQTRSETKQGKDILHDVLNHKNTGAFVTEFDTGAILYANDYIKDILGQDIVGRPCWEVFHGKKEKCGLCKPEFLNAYECISKCFNAKGFKDYEVHSRLISWLGGRQAYLSYATEADKMLAVPQHETGT